MNSHAIPAVVLDTAESLLAPTDSLQHKPYMGEEVGEGFKKAMRRLTSTVTIITTSHRRERFGMIATAVSSVSADPPSIVIGVNHAASIFEPLMSRGRFAVNMLTCEDAHLINVFGGKIKGPERFNHGDWQDEDDLPSLSSSQTTLLCTVAKTMSYGSHELIIGIIEKVRIRDALAPLLWQDGKPAASIPLQS
ncbi:flavin reductase family protein [Pseudomonas viridiflava]|uniref:flavin reductase family protein n=1 Tax=Pseudomonas syringae group TaxID=136849 RepID=UPI001F1204F9|nr:flavin reductase family protein [Pseudomonas viridiflava]MCQ9390548.1 flavin reductase family protein [Pseudomonas viridiflava]